MENQLFPVFLKLEQLHVLIVGGGAIGLEKISAVLNNSPKAKVTLVARHILPDIKAFKKKSKKLTISPMARHKKIISVTVLPHRMCLHA